MGEVFPERTVVRRSTRGRGQVFFEMVIVGNLDE